MNFKLTKINPENLSENAFQIIGKDWMLITAGNIDKFNFMTGGWGTLGVLWNKPVALCYVRPTRHTYQFMEEFEYFTLSFFTPDFKKVLDYCGKVSGRDTDKLKNTGLTIFETENKNVAFNEARLIIECRKIYFEDINPKNFVDKTIEKNYPIKDYHRMYVGEITNCYIKN
jgi:flavin reductase (DIM6/NTAB) family NADH-FMN oxidoreductase RutF